MSDGDDDDDQETDNKDAIDDQKQDIGDIHSKLKAENCTFLDKDILHKNEIGLLSRNLNLQFKDFKELLKKNNKNDIQKSCMLFVIIMLFQNFVTSFIKQTHKEKGKCYISLFLYSM